MADTSLQNAIDAAHAEITGELAKTETPPVAESEAIPTAEVSDGEG